VDVFRPNGPTFPKKIWSRVVRDIAPDTGRLSPYKYHVRYADVPDFDAPGVPEVEQLFDLRRDPYERHNLARQVNNRRHQASLARLRRRLEGIPADSGGP